MKVFYYCNTGYHLSIIAGNIHLGILSRTERPTTKKIADLEGFGMEKNKEIGKITKVGETPEGHEIYAVGVLGEQEVAEKAINSLLSVMGIDKNKYLLVSTHKHLNMSIKLGIRLEQISKQLRNRLIENGLGRNYFKLVQSIEETEEKLYY